MNSTMITGRNIYVDRKGNIIYYDFLSKRGYILTTANTSMFYLYKNRLIISLLITILLTDYFPNLLTPLFLGSILLVGLEVFFRLRFFSKLPSCPLKKDFKKRTLLNALLLKQSAKKVFLKMILYFSFSILIILNAYYQNATIIIFLFSIILSIASGYYGIIHLLALQKFQQ